MHRFEIKAAISTDDAGTITGMAWPFGSPDRVGDVFEKGAFSGLTLPLPILFGHDPNQPVGVWTEANETDRGLEVRGKLLIDEVSRAREVRALVREGAITGLSVGFRAQSAKPRAGGGRVISRAELAEISLVVIPAHPGARITGAKSASSILADAINRAAAQLRN